MDGLSLTLFLTSAFVGGLTGGFAGFAMGLVVSGVWLHLVTPLQTAVLIVGYALPTQGYSIWRLRHALSWVNATPMMIGSVIGAPCGTLLLTYVNPAWLRDGVGVLLVLYSVYGLTRPHFKELKTGAAADFIAGMFNGILGGMTGLVGVIATVWCQMRGWPKDQQRITFQLVTLAAAVVGGVSLAFAGAVTAETVKLYLYGLPAMLAGIWCGFELYGRLDEAAFRKVILLLLLVSGAMLMVPASLLHFGGAR